MVSQPENLEFRILNSYLLHVLLKMVTKCLVTRADAARDSNPQQATHRNPYCPSWALPRIHIDPCMHHQRHI